MDYKLLSKIFLYNVIFMIAWILGEMIFTDRATILMVFFPFFMTPFWYFVVKRFNLL
ncbi:hypothetical protein [Bacillus infantis]|uniref:hypothetical protein n=1 Tax=Bacillus infantis TaxID=324767 RepID=UPI0020A1AB60|nr:hypothetical protein [Bacillus infantis]MCP1159361.1 hypothetical protein [Bacillus infantis]